MEETLGTSLRRWRDRLSPRDVGLPEQTGRRAAGLRREELAALAGLSVDYLVRPVEVLAEAARVLRPGAPVVLTFSNRCFPTKAVRGWLSTDDDGRCAIVAEYLRRAGGFAEPEVTLRTPPGRERGGRYRGDPLYAVVARRL